MQEVKETKFFIGSFVLTQVICEPDCLTKKKKSHGFFVYIFISGPDILIILNFLICKV